MPSVDLQVGPFAFINLVQPSTSHSTLQRVSHGMQPLMDIVLVDAFGRKEIPSTPSRVREGALNTSPLASICLIPSPLMYIVPAGPAESGLSWTEPAPAKVTES